MPTVKVYESFEEMQARYARQQRAEIEKRVTAMKPFLPESFTMEASYLRQIVRDENDKVVADIHLGQNQITFVSPDVPDWLMAVAKALETVNEGRNVEILTNFRDLPRICP